MKRLVVIDGHAILHRAYHALPPLTTSKGLIVNAVYGFASILLRVIESLQPTHLVVAFDTPEPTFRNKLFKDYQIQRPKVDDEFIPQINLVKKLVQEMGIPTFEKVGYEADDVIGTIAKKANADEVIIVTGDRDILQLVDDKVGVYMPVKGISESKLYKKEEVEEKFGVSPSQIIDYKALVGDQSDNYPGVAGIGPKTASTLLQRFQTLEQIYKNKKDIESEKVKKALDDYLKSAQMAKKLATIVTDVPLEFNVDECKLPNLDKPNIHRLFEEFEFRTLITRLSGNKTQSRRSGIHDAVIPIKSGTASGQTSLF
ncbi:hypothetical protein HY029_04170 [Candidatus Gottesmanbacteria bacterium]|nr:hypothetical protein [Candidatus Gottesmanbacteria bacterium]